MQDAETQQAMELIGFDKQAILQEMMQNGNILHLGEDCDSSGSDSEPSEDNLEP